MRSQSTYQAVNDQHRIAIEIKNESGATLFSNFTAEENFLLSRSVSQSGRQIGKHRCGTLVRGPITLKVVTYSKDLINSSRLFGKLMQAIGDTIQFFIEESKTIEIRGNQNLRRLVHNITTYNALAQQEIELLLPQSQMTSKTRAEQLAFAEETISNSPGEVADSVLKLTKYIQGIKAEISSFDKLFKKDPELKILKHEVHRVIMNTMYLFFPDFTDKQINFKIKPSELVAYFDYESINVALYHLINNAAKYCFPDSQFEIDINDFGRNVRITMYMISLRIDESEVKDIFKEGYSGRHARAAKLNGSGVGMYLVRELIRLNHGAIDLQIDRSGSQMLAGHFYDKNLFIIELPAQRIVPDYSAAARE